MLDSSPLSASPESDRSTLHGSRIGSSSLRGTGRNSVLEYSIEDFFFQLIFFYEMRETEVTIVYMIRRFSPNH